MSDFAVLGTIRAYLASHLGEDRVCYDRIQQQEENPCCILELEEIWTHISSSSDKPQSRLKFKTTCVHDQVGLRPGLELNEKVIRLLEGQVFHLEDGRKATIKSIGAASKYYQEKEKKMISQYFESLIWG